MFPPPNIILFELDFDVKFPLLQFLSDLKSTIVGDGEVTEDWVLHVPGGKHNATIVARNHIQYNKLTKIQLLE